MDQIMAVFGDKGVVFGGFENRVLAKTQQKL